MVEEPEKMNEDEINPVDTAPSAQSEVDLDAQRMIEDLQKDLEETRAKADEYLNGWQRTLADFANYRKRVERDNAQVYQNSVGTIVKYFIDVLDDLERALKHQPKRGEGAAWASGIELVYRKLLAALEGQGVKPMEAEGQMFDPNLHEAVTHEDSDHHESGQIIEVLQKGYLIGDRVLRPAVVRVAR